MEKRRVYIDMDGVLCEYRENVSLEEMESDGYFKKLAPRQSMIEAVKYLVESGENDVFILSAVLPGKAKEITKDKNDWLDKNLPIIDSKHRIFPLCGTDKADAVNGVRSQDVLFDDYSTNLNLWHKAGGIAVKILNEVNGKNGSFVAGPRLKINHREDLVNTLNAI